MGSVHIVHKYTGNPIELCQLGRGKGHGIVGYARQSQLFITLRIKRVYTMPRCEMCGGEESTLTPIKVSGAELDVCDSCSSVGTRLEPDDADEGDSTETKYSTESSPDQPSSTGEAANSATEHGDPGAEMPNSLAPDYADRIRDGRNQSGLTVEELADRINEKASYIRKIEREEMQPDTTTQMQLEQFLNIDLTVSEQNEWMSDSYQSEQ